MLNLILHDTQQLLRKALKKILEENGNLCVHEAVDIDQADLLLEKLDDVGFLICDIAVQGSQQLFEKAIGFHRNIRILVFSESREISYIKNAFASGASAYLLKECLMGELFLAMDCAMRGRKYVCSGLSAKLVEETSKLWESPLSTDINFSARELEILQLISIGLTNNEISNKLFLSKRTVEGHRQSLLDKTGSRNSAHLIGLATKIGLV